MKVTTLWTDGDPENNPDNTSRFTLNGNLNKEKNSLTNEGSFIKIPSYPTQLTPNAKTIGSITLDYGRKCVFSVIENNSHISSEIGILSSDNEYEVILRDNLDDEINLNFSKEHLIQGTFKMLYNGHPAIYWTDRYNVPRWLDLTTPQVSINTDRQIMNLNELNLLSIFSSFQGSRILLNSVNTGGNLPSGVYYIAIAYADKSQNKTDYSQISNPISITPSIQKVPMSSYDGTPANSATSKAITFSIPSADLDRKYSYVSVVIISKINQQYNQYDLGLFSIPETGDFVNVIQTLDNSSDITLDEILIPKARYSTAKTITQLDDVLYMANLTSELDLGLQPYINGVIVDYVTKPKDLSVIDSSYRDEVSIFFDKSFMWDEVYSLYLTATLTNGQETVAYHIPGRPAFNINLGGSDTSVNETALINTLTDSTNFNLGNEADTTPGGQIYSINSNARIYHAFNTADNSNVINIYGSGLGSNMGFWQNLNETYPDSNNWDIKGNLNTVIGTLRGEKVRHHKFPHPQEGSIKMHPNQGSAQNYNEVNVLGITLKNISIPTSLVNKISKLNLYYGKRDAINRTILGQSTLLNDSGWHINDNNNFGHTNQILNGVGNASLFHIHRSASDYDSGSRTYTNNSAYALTPCTGFDESDFNYSINGSRANYSGLHWDYGVTAGNPFGNGYYRFHAFDLLANNASIAGATHTKQLFRINSRYQQDYSDGDPEADPDGGVDHPVNYALGMEWNPINNSSEYFGITNTAKYNKIRILKTKSYIPSQYPYQSDFLRTSNPFGMDNYIHNYGGEQNILLEARTRIIYDNTTQDCANLNLSSPTDLANSFGSTAANAGAYLSNLCQFKEDIFLDFSKQELVFSGYSGEGNDILISNIYGGDMFTNLYAFRSSLELGSLASDSGGFREFFNFRSIHSFVCQSISNINFRHNGETNLEQYYPKVSALSINSLPTTWDNWWGYNKDYSSVNDIRQPKIIQKVSIDEYNRFITRVIRSGKNNPESIVDNFRSFLANDSIDLNKNKGQIENLSVIDNKLIIHLSNSINTTLGRETLDTSNATASIGSGDIFSIIPRDTVWTEAGYGGTQSQWAGCTTQYGYFFPDASSGKVFMLGASLAEISIGGLFNFFRDNLPFSLTKELDQLTFDLTPEWAAGTYTLKSIVKYNNRIYMSTRIVFSGDIPSISTGWLLLGSFIDGIFTNEDNTVDNQSIGIVGAFDYKYNRYILSKKDYITTSNFTDIFRGIYSRQQGSYTGEDIVSFNGRLYRLIYNPIDPTGLIPIDTLPPVPTYIYGEEINFEDSDLFVPRKFTISYYPEYKGWGSYYDYYPDTIFHTNKKVVSSKDYNIYEHNSDTDFCRFYDQTSINRFIVEPIYNKPDGVKRLSSVQIETKAQASRPSLSPYMSNTEIFLKTFDQYFTYDSYQISQTKDIVNRVSARNNEGYWNINDFRDMTTNNSNPLFITNLYNKEPNTTNIDNNKHWSKQKKFVDQWFGIRLIHNNNYYEAFTLVDTTESTSTTVIEGIGSSNFSVGEMVFIIQNGIGVYRMIIETTDNSITLNDIIDNNYIFVQGEINKVIPVSLHLLNTSASLERNYR